MERPIIDKSTHPIYSGDYNIVTNEVEKAQEEVEKLLNNRIPGGIIYGDPRMGKTRAINVIADQLKTVYGDKLPIYIHGMTEHISTENNFYRGLLQDIGYSNYTKWTALDKKDRIIASISTDAACVGSKKVVLFIDEANCMNSRDYSWLMDIHNRLERGGVHLTTILFGTIDLKNQKTSFVQGNLRQIVDRFMVYEYKFSGIKDISDFQTCLAAYDFGSTYPANSDWTFTRYFFPEAFDAGSRLSQEAEIMFQSFSNAKPPRDKNEPFEIPTQFVFLAIENLLKEFGANGRGQKWISKKDIEAAIENSGYKFSG